MAVVSRNPREHWLKPHFLKNEVANSGGWLVVFDPDMAKPWDEKISHEDRVVDGKTIHLFFC